MKFIALTVVAAAVASGCSVVDVVRIHGSGVSASRSLKPSPFKSIETNGAFDIEIQQADNWDLTVTGDDNIIKLVKFENKGDALVIWVDENYSAETRLKVVAKMPDVEGLVVNGSGKAVLKGLEGDKLKLEINGSGEMTANGKVGEISAKINGSGEIDAGEVESDAASAAISGSGTIRVHAKSSLSGAVSGSGEIRYKGKPQVSKSIDGSGEIEPM